MNLKYHTKNQQGFTLIELLIYIALLTIFITGAIFFAWDIIFGRVKSSVQQELNQNMRFASQRIAYEIRNASAINLVSATNLSLAQADSARNPTIISLSAGRIMIGWGSSGSCPTTAPCPLTSSDVAITTLTFTNLSSGNAANVRFSITGQSSGNRTEYQGTQTITGSGEIRRD
jgi:prepilin-type N-terminal cleavage/methylation domain-containing protein